MINLASKRRLPSTKFDSMCIEDAYTIVADFYDLLKQNRSQPELRYALKQILYQVRKHSPILIEAIEGNFDYAYTRKLQSRT